MEERLREFLDVWARGGPRANHDLDEVGIFENVPDEVLGVWTEIKAEPTLDARPIDIAPTASQNGLPHLGLESFSFIAHRCKLQANGREHKGWLEAYRS